VKLPKTLQGKTWSTPQGPVDSSDVERVLDAIARGASRASAIPGVFGDSDRRVDKATQLLRKAGLIKLRVLCGRVRPVWVLVEKEAKP
jgi:hypothetical protein